MDRKDQRSHAGDLYPNTCMRAAMVKQDVEEDTRIIAKVKKNLVKKELENEEEIPKQGVHDADARALTLRLPP